MPRKKFHKKWIENLKKRREPRKEDEESIPLEPSVFADVIQAKEEIVSEHDLDLNEEYIYKINTPGIKVEIEDYIKSENEVKIEEMTFGDYDADLNLPAPIVSQSEIKVEPFIHEEVEDEPVVPSGASAPADLEQSTEEIGSGHDLQEKINSIIKTECFFPSSEMSCFSFSRKRCRREYSDCAISDLLDESCYFDFSDETLTTPAKRLRTSSSPPTQTHENLAALPLTMKQETDPLQVHFAPMTSDVLEIPSPGSRPDIHLEDTFSDDHMIEKSKHSVKPTPVPRRFSEQKMADLSINKCLAKSKDLAEMSEASPETKIKEFIDVPGPSSHPDLTLKELPLEEDLSATTIDLSNICEPSTAQEVDEELASKKIVLDLDDDSSFINNALDLLHNLPQTQQLPKYNSEGSKETNLEQMDPGLSPVEGKEVDLKDLEKVEKEIESDDNVDSLPTVGGESVKLATEEMKESIGKCEMEHRFERTKIPPRYVPRETIFKDFDPDPLNWDTNIETCIVQIPQITKLLKDSLICKTCGEGDIEVELKSNERTNFNEILILKCNTCNKRLSEGMCSELVEIQNEIKNLSEKVAITVVAWIMAVLDSGIGYTKMSMAFSALNIAPLSSMSYDYNKKWIVEGTFKKAQNMKKLAADAVKSFYEVEGGQQVDGLLNIPVLFDGTFMKKGFDSLLFIGFVTEIETGIILDFEIMTKLCSTCEKHQSMEKSMSKVEFDEMRRKHKGVCLINFDVEKSSGSMKPAVAKAIFERSPFLGLRYTTLLTDEDSSVYKTLKEANIYGYKFPIQKQNCLNHLNKKLYNRLHKIRFDSSLGGNRPGNLTQDVCKLFSDLYGKCVKKFNKSYKLIKRTVLGSIFHYASSDNRPMHFLCQKGKNSPCEFQKLTSNNKPIPQDWHEKSVKHKINTETAETLITVLEPFLRDDVLEKASQGAQNIKESLHSRLWDTSPRINFRPFVDVKYAVCRTFLLHNIGAGEIANTTVGKYQSKIIKQDKLRRMCRRKNRNFYEKIRRKRIRLLREQEDIRKIHT